MPRAGSNSGNPLLQQKPPSKSKTCTAACAWDGALTGEQKLWITAASPALAPYNPAAPRRVFHNMSADLWRRGCERLAAELPEQQFNTWIRPLPAAEVAEHGDTGTVVTVRVPNRFKLDWIRNQYAGRIETVLSEIAGKPVRLDVTLANRDTPVSGVIMNHSGGPMNGAVGHSTTAANGNMPGIAAAAIATRMQAGTAEAPSRSRLNPGLTFDNLVPGRANQMARPAALPVAGAPGS